MKFDLTRNIYVVAFGVMFVVLNSVQATPACQDPTDAELRQMLSIYSPNGIGFIATSGAYDSPADTSCPLTYSNGASLSTRSTCPFYHLHNTDTLRYPPTMLDVKCYDCDKCISDLSPSYQHPKWKCERVMQSVWVLQKTEVCINGVYQYNAVQTNVAVSCACGRKRI
ncbi:interleukin 17-like protein [Saccoglossus kowalevskii]|uniref:Interleukin 17-like protein-like n=1 Tax=Saccoglossus kowalevskii TaxID=10224 RepID=A0ABM0MTB9_SACKO|nr:PREDICTED: interleukin 17-like protein-like [Saccoglossus kowalevskii]